MSTSESEKSATETAGAEVRTPPNHILGWFVVGALAFVVVVILVTFGGEAVSLNPVALTAAVVLLLGLVAKRLLRGTFGLGWFLATAIVGFLLFFGSAGLISAAAESGDDPGTAGGELLALPGILALIATIKAGMNSKRG